ncbi:MAG TPA: CoA pyrophosphatase [Devosiaceae bacterium]|jgi:8-oxo-dGTP pyrophosphatase MutT (NUDIX family)|nr:CoA pyrophosphatase [Devosiaceae bacterium]
MLAVGDDLIQRIAARLLARPEPVDDEGSFMPDWMPDEPFNRPPVPAAVLIGLVEHPEGHAVLYTQRSATLRNHSGQIAFPGGKIDPEDADAAAAALREASEEVALSPPEAQILGYLPNYYTGTNYLITPVVAAIRPTRPFLPNPGEVDFVFEVPLDLLLRGESYHTLRLTRGGVEHTTWQINYDGRRIWGITANLTRRFFDLALTGEV